jgi:hypothetical protein
VRGEEENDRAYRNIDDPVHATFETRANVPTFVYCITYANVRTVYKACYCHMFLPPLYIKFLNYVLLYIILYIIYIIYNNNRSQTG